MKIFVDANIFFAATYNPKGGSAYILNLSRKEKSLKLITTTHIISEAYKNILLKLGEKKLDYFYKLLLLTRPKIEFLTLTPKEINFYSKFVDLKDVPVLAGANKLKANFLLTLDRKHFLNRRDVFEKEFTFKIVNTAELIKILNI